MSLTETNAVPAPDATGAGPRGIRQRSGRDQSVAKPKAQKPKTPTKAEAWQLIWDRLMPVGLAPLSVRFHPRCDIVYIEMPDDNAPVTDMALAALGMKPGALERDAKGELRIVCPGESYQCAVYGSARNTTATALPGYDVTLTCDVHLDNPEFKRLTTSGDPGERREQILKARENLAARLAELDGELADLQPPAAETKTADELFPIERWTAQRVDVVIVEHRMSVQRGGLLTVNVRRWGAEPMQLEQVNIPAAVWALPDGTTATAVLSEDKYGDLDFKAWEYPLVDADAATKVEAAA